MPARDVRQWVGAAVVAVAVLVAALMPSGDRTVRAAVPGPPPQAAGFTWDPSIDPGTRAIVEQALASARPEAQRLVDRVDGATTLAIGKPAGGNLGLAAGDGTTYRVLLDVGAVYRESGQRGVNRLVLHELGHVIDGLLVDPELNAQLDAGIPPGLPCPAGTRIGSCAPEAERFAETFAKWAMHDIGLDLYIGYAVPAPADLEAWGQPLSGL